MKLVSLPSAYKKFEAGQHSAGSDPELYLKRFRKLVTARANKQAPFAPSQVHAPSNGTFFLQEVRSAQSLHWVLPLVGILPRSQKVRPAITCNKQFKRFCNTADAFTVVATLLFVKSDLGGTIFSWKVAEREIESVSRSQGVRAP